ncbi:MULTISPECIES: TauD/TfdA dioxygenase family protein [unclassified Candidatus Pelagibacter]|jgi:alpha-ketoglutarate-dependent taurine dioxygenase|uniref:TauD/TfdA dioxygenase family protein n=1 Tax=unclassified Candidatus Pelagibacter TaxID=2647897 RepID=UPI003F82917A
MFKIIPNKKNIGAEIIGNVKKISKKDFKIFLKALELYGMIFFRRQKLNSSHYIAFAKHFGKLANYPRLKGLSKKYKQITVVQRKATDKGPSFGEQFHTDSIYTKKPPRFTMLYSKLVPKKGRANTEFSSQYLAYDYLPKSIKNKLLKVKGRYSSEGPISVTTRERVKEKGRKIEELKSIHKIIKKINSKNTIYCSPGHLVGFSPNLKNSEKVKKQLFKHQVKKKFQYSLEWEKDQLAIWDNRSMLHQATPFKGNRIMHRITIL